MRRKILQYCIKQTTSGSPLFPALIVVIVFSRRSISSKIFPLTNSLNLLSKQLASQEQPALISLNQGVFCDKSSSWVLGAACWEHSTRTGRQKGGICICLNAFPCAHIVRVSIYTSTPLIPQSRSHSLLICTHPGT